MGQFRGLVELQRGRRLRPGQDVRLFEQRPVRQPRVQQRLPVGRLRPEGGRRMPLPQSGHKRPGGRFSVRDRCERREIEFLPQQLQLEQHVGHGMLELLLMTIAFRRH